jgi:hypothetical protein
MITGTIGYNESKFTMDARSPGGVLIYSDGAVIPNSPPPWVYSLSAHHNFSLFNGQPFYWHADIAHRSEERREGQTDPASPNYNPDLSPLPSYRQVNARIGALWGHLEFSLFARNLTNEQPDLDLRNNHPYTGYRSFIWSNQTLRPRTIGILMSYRY